jgi:hypothetical protein
MFDVNGKDQKVLGNIKSYLLTENLNRFNPSLQEEYKKKITEILDKYKN